MTSFPIHQIDAFAERQFEGNPAAVVPLEDWIPDRLMQAVALENQLSETAFLVPAQRPSSLPERDGTAASADFELRWFTPAIEVPLCGHATLASAFVVFRHLAPASESVTFRTRSGPLTVTRDGDDLRMDLPAGGFAEADLTPALRAVLPAAPREVLVTDRAYVVVFDEARLVRQFEPDFAAISRLPLPYLSVTAPGDDVDFVSRFFAPSAGVPEDPVTGSNHCVLAPYWAERLGRSVLTARQLSARGGRLTCEVGEDRVALVGRCVPYLTGTIDVSIDG